LQDLRKKIFIELLKESTQKWRRSVTIKKLEENEKGPYRIERTNIKRLNSNKGINSSLKEVALIIDEQPAHGKILKKKTYVPGCNYN
ncbi:16053_t:CDS:2, partial [Funneliformis mosseae]